MRQNRILLGVVIALLSSCDGLLATTDSVMNKVVRERETSLQIKVSADTLHSATRYLRGVKVAEDDGEERTFDDPVINKYLHLFKDWAKLKESPESVFRSLDLPAVMRRAYKSGKWKRLLNNENYIIYRKYQKYLKLIETSRK